MHSENSLCGVEKLMIAEAGRRALPIARTHPQHFLPILRSTKVVLTSMKPHWVCLQERSELRLHSRSMMQSVSNQVLLIRSKKPSAPRMRSTQEACMSIGGFINSLAFSIGLLSRSIAFRVHLTPFVNHPSRRVLSGVP